MLTLNARNQILIGLGLASLLLITRGQHFATVHSLPSAAWAVFFLAGVYLRPAWALVALLAGTWLLDFAAFRFGGASSFCLTPAYVFLLPAYTALWLAGRWYARRHRFAWPTLLPLGAAVVTGALVCELFSSGGFYWFSGRFAGPSWAEFGARLVRYFPTFLGAMAFYVGIAAAMHLSIGATRITTGPDARTQ